MKRVRFLSTAITLLFNLMLYAQNMGVKLSAGSSPNTTLDINGAVAYREGSALSLSNGVNSNVALSENSLFRVTGPTAAFSITGFTGGVDGKVLTIINATSQTMSLTHQATSSAANQINTGGSTINIGANGVAFLIYNSTLSKWVLSGGQGFTNTAWNLSGNSGTTAGTNFVGTTDGQDLVFKTNNTEGMRLTNTGRYLGLGTNSPSYKLHIEEPGGYDGDIAVRLYNNNTASYFPSLIFQASRGTKSTPSAANTNTVLGVVRYGGYDGSAFSDIYAAEIKGWATENWSTTAHGTKLTFGTIANASTSISERMVIDQNGYIGIGTSTPGRKLTISRSGSNTDTEDDILIQSYGTYRAPAFIMTSGRGSEASPSNLSSGDTLGGIYFKGYANSGDRSLGAITNIYTGDGTTTKSIMAFNTSGSGTVNERMRIDENGKIGIGQSAPTDRLEILNENTDDNYDDMSITTYNASTTPSISLRRAKGSATSPTSIGNSEYCAGFNTHVYNGSSFISATSMYASSESDFTTTQGVSLVFGSSRSGTLSEKMRLTSQGSLCIANTNTATTHKINVTGTAGLSTGTSWTNTSDFRVKENIEPYKRGLKEIIALKPVFYTYKENSGLGNGERNIGIIAQEVEKILPEAIMTAPITLKNGSVIQDGKHLYRADAIWFAMINAFQEQQNMIQKQQSEIESLKQQQNKSQSEIDILKAELTKISAQINALSKQ